MLSLVLLHRWPPAAVNEDDLCPSRDNGEQPQLTPLPKICVYQVSAGAQGHGKKRPSIGIANAIANPRVHYHNLSLQTACASLKRVRPEESHFCKHKGPKGCHEQSTVWLGLSNFIELELLSFRRQTSDNMDRWKAEMERVREKRRVEERRSEKRKSQKKEDADARRGRKVAKTCVFPMTCGSGGSKSMLAKAAGAEPSGQMRRKSARSCGAKHISKSKCTKHTRVGPLLEVEMSKKCTPLWREDARSTFRSQNVKNTSASEHF